MRSTGKVMVSKGDAAGGSPGKGSHYKSRRSGLEAHQRSALPRGQHLYLFSDNNLLQGEKEAHQSQPRQ